MLTFRANANDKLRAFNIGADDYVTKPFHIEILAARVKAMLRRSSLPARTPFGHLRFRKPAREFQQPHCTPQRRCRSAYCKRVRYTPVFLSNTGGGPSVEDRSLRNVWGIPFEISTRTIDRHVSALRKKIEPDPEDPVWIKTVYGVGYRFMQHPRHMEKPHPVFGARRGSLPASRKTRTYQARNRARLPSLYSFGSAMPSWRLYASAEAAPSSSRMWA